MALMAACNVVYRYTRIGHDIGQIRLDHFHDVSDTTPFRAQNIDYSTGFGVIGHTVVVVVLSLSPSFFSDVSDITHYRLSP